MKCGLNALSYKVPSNIAAEGGLCVFLCVCAHVAVFIILSPTAQQYQVDVHERACVCSEWGQRLDGPSAGEENTISPFG